MSTTSPLGRLSYEGDLTPIIERLCQAYGLEKPEKFSIIETGYEDCNVAIDTSGQKYLAKIFSKGRTPEVIDRYSDIIDRAIQAGINHPPLFKTLDGGVTFQDKNQSNLAIVLMKFIKGQTFLDLNRAPNAEERQTILEQAAKINCIDYHPPYYLDSWAIPNIHTMFGKVRQLMQVDDLALVEKAVRLYDQIPIDDLPHCLVHGDFTKANILKGEDGEIYILDFSVTNWYPRILELSVIASNLLYEENDKLARRDKVNLVADEYSQFNPLTSEERTHLYAYSLAGTAMEVMGSYQEKFINGNDTQETDYWLKIGRDGLKRELG